MIGEDVRKPYGITRTEMYWQDLYCDSLRVTGIKRNATNHLVIR
jgi:hypothetical protein